MPREFDKAGLKLLTKLAELSQKIGGHALAAYADKQHAVHYYASSALRTLVAEPPLLNFLRQQLVELWRSHLSVSVA